MSLLSECAPSRWVEFLSIPDDAAPIPTRAGKDTDLFVGKNNSATITLNNSTKIQFRDVVVLGELIINSSNPENIAVKPHLIVRDLFIPGRISTSNICLKGRNFYELKNIETFRSELQKLFLEWLSIQRESVKQIGLKSILV